MEECNDHRMDQQKYPATNRQTTPRHRSKSAIGHGAALELARAGAEVTLISRSEEKAQDA